MQIFACVFVYLGMGILGMSFPMTGHEKEQWKKHDTVESFFKADRIGVNGVGLFH